jgi:4-amino-4-deoxy-L-arabinose transferase-like glycosyltransferase
MGWPLAALLALTLLRLALAALLPLTPDEAYYFAWSRLLQPGYLDHPPMVALWIRAGTALLGNGPAGVRLLGPLAAALGSLALADAGARLWPGRGAGLAAAALFNATLMLGAGCVLMTPDTPLLFFWVLGLWALARLAAGGDARWWLAAGGFAGLALLSKYTAVFFLAGAGLWALTAAAIRPQLRTAWPWTGLALALLLFSPDIVWNAAHHWASYRKQGGRVAGFDLGRSLQFLGELLGGQALLFTPVIAVLAARGLWRLGRERSPGAALALWLSLPPAAIFLEHVLSGRVQANWAAIIYPAACLAAGALPRRWLGAALASGFAVTALVYVQAVAAPFPLPAARDPAALQLAGWRDFAQAAAASHPAFLTSDDYATAAALAYYAPRDVPVLGFGPRWQDFAWRMAAPDQPGLLILRGTGETCPDQLGTILRTRRGETAMSYRVCRFMAPGPGKIFPRP